MQPDIEKHTAANGNNGRHIYVVFVKNERIAESCKNDKQYDNYREKREPVRASAKMFYSKIRKVQKQYTAYYMTAVAEWSSYECPPWTVSEGYVREKAVE